MNEYVIKLGTIIDNDGVQQILKYMDMTKLKALGLTAAITGISGAIYKFASSAAKYEFDLIEIAKKQKGTTASINASQQALKAMGKTIEQVSKDRTLNKVYNEIRALNAELELPGFKNTMERLTNLRTSFWKFKSVLNMAAQSIGRHFLINMQRPLEKINKALDDMTHWFKTNFNTISSAVSVALTDFSKGILGIGETIGYIFTLIGKLPDGVKAIGAAALAMFGFIKSGPLGQILALIGLVGDVIHDADNWQWNKDNRESKKYLNEDGTVKQIPLAFEEIWDVVFDPENTNVEDKAGRVATLLIEKLTDSIEKLLSGIQGELVVGDFLEGKDGFGGIFGAIKRWFDKNGNSAKVGQLGKSILQFLQKCFLFVGGYSGSLIGNLFNVIFGHGTVEEGVLKDETTATTFAGTLATFVNGVIKGLNDNKTFIESVKQGLSEGVMGGIATAIAANLKITDKGVEIDWTNVKVDLTTTAETMLGIVSSGMYAGIDVGSMILKGIGKTLGDTNLEINPDSDSSKGLIASIGNYLQKWAENSTIVGGLEGAILTAVSGGNLFESLVGGIFGAYEGARKKVQKEIKARAHREAGSDGDRHKWIEQSSADDVEAWLKGKGIDTNEYWSGMLGDMVNSAGTMISDIWDIACSTAIEVGDLSGSLLSTFLTTIVKALTGESDVTKNLEDVIKKLGGNTIFESLGTAIGLKMAGAGFIESVIGGLFTGINSLQALADENGWTFAEALEHEAGEFWGLILDAWLGPLTDTNDPNSPRRTELGLASVVMPILEGEVDEIKDATGKVIKKKTKGGGLLGWLFGYDEYAEYDKTGKKIESSVKHVKGIFEKAWEGEDGSGGIQGLFNSVDWEGLFKPITSALEEAFNSAWGNIKKNLPDWLTDLFGLENEKITFKQNDDGTVTMQKDTGESIVTDQETAKAVEDAGATLARQRELFGVITTAEGLRLPGMKEMIDEAADKGPAGNGKLVGDTVMNAYSRLLTAAAESSDTRAFQYLAESFSTFKGKWEDGASLMNVLLSMKTFIDNYTKNGVPEGWQAPGEDKGPTGKGPKPIGTTANTALSDGGGGFSLGEGVDKLNSNSDAAADNIRDASDASKGMEKSFSAFGLMLELASAKAEKFGDRIKGAGLTMEDDLKGLSPAAGDAKGALGELAGAASAAAGALGEIGGGDGEKKAFGGRIGKRMDGLTVGEDGAEYIIPITKQERATSLIMQMLNEMGAATISRVASGLGLGSSGTNGASISSLDSAMNGMTMTNNYNINAPVSINVQSSGADAKEIGSSIYDLAERQLIKNVMGVYS